MNWNQVVSDIGPRLYRYFCGSFSPQTASDLTQETLIRLIKKNDDGHFDPSKGSLIMLAYGIARMVRLEAWKSAPPEEVFANPSDFDDRVSHPIDQNLLESNLLLLRSSIAELSEPQRQIVLLHIDEDLTLQQISELMKIPLNTVKSHIHRAKETLRKKLNDKGVHHE